MKKKKEARGVHEVASSFIRAIIKLSDARSPKEEEEEEEEAGK